MMSTNVSLKLTWGKNWLEEKKITRKKNNKKFDYKIIIFKFKKLDLWLVNNFTNAQIINALIKQKFTGVDNIFFPEHSNMLTNGDPNDNLLKDDQ
jgi:hypothetical protein